MIEKLKKLQENSYSPYSKFPVSAIVVCKDGSEYVGVNVENASYGAGICAERSAITSAVSHGKKIGDFQELHIMISGGEIGMPCFICRQVIFEFFDQDSKVYCYSTKGEVEVHTVKELCPYPFGKDDLV